MGHVTLTTLITG